jgi:hypothetical protein
MHPRRCTDSLKALTLARDRTLQTEGLSISIGPTHEKPKVTDPCPPNPRAYVIVMPYSFWMLAAGYSSSLLLFPDKDFRAPPLMPAPVEPSVSLTSRSCRLVTASCWREGYSPGRIRRGVSVSPLRADGMYFGALSRHLSGTKKKPAMNLSG